MSKKNLKRMVMFINWRYFSTKKEAIKKIALEALGGFIFWTVTLTPYMLFVVRVDFTQYVRWVGMGLIIMPLLAPLSIKFMNWFVNRFRGKE